MSKSNLVEIITGTAAIIALAAISVLADSSNVVNTQTTTTNTMRTPPKTIHTFEYKDGPYKNALRMIENAEKIRNNASFDTRVGNTVIVNTFDGNFIYTFRSNGKINDIRTPFGDTFIFNYDYRDRIIGVKGTEGTNMKFEYDYSDKLIAESNGRFWRKYTYDYRGNLTKEVCSDETNIEYSYDYDGNLKDIRRR